MYLLAITMIDTSMPQPFVSVVMPIRNEAAWIERGLTAILTQDYPLDCMEVIVADGMSDDGTREIIQSFITRHPTMAIRLLDNPQRIIPTGLNSAIQAARGDVIARVDGHTLIAPNY